MAINYSGGNDAVITGAFAPVMQTLQRNYLFEQQKKQQEAQQIQDLTKQIQGDLAKVSANGLRQADVADFTKTYSGVKDTYYKFLNAKSPEERSNYAIQINEGLSGLNSLVNTSKQYGDLYSKSLGGLANFVGKGRVDDMRERLTSLRDKPSSALTRESFDVSDLVYTYDPTKVESAVSRLGSTLLSSVTPVSERIGTRSTSGGRNYDTVRSTQAVSDQTIFERMSDLAKRDRNVQSYVEDVMTQNDIDFNTAVAQVSEEFKDKFVKVDTKDELADKAAPRTTVVNVNMPSEAVASNYYTTSVGSFTSPESTTYSEKVPLIGLRDIYTSGGQKITRNFSNIDFDGQALLRLPVDASGNPLPTNRQGEATNQNQVAGYRQFVAGTIPTYDFPDPEIQRLVTEQALLPMSQIQWIGQSKARRSDLRGVQNEAEQRPVTRDVQNNSVPSQTRSGVRGLPDGGF